MRYAILMCAAFFWTAPLFADTLCLKNGNAISGIIREEDEHTVVLEINIGTVKFNKNEIREISRSTTPNEARALRSQWKEEQDIRREEAREHAERARSKSSARQEAEAKVKVDGTTGHIITPALINGKVRVNLVVDTGASIIVLSASAWKKLLESGVKPKSPPERKEVDLVLGDGRKVKAQFVLLDSVQVKDSVAEQVEAAVMPDDQAPAQQANYDGVLGMSFLDRFNFGFNRKEGTLTLEPLR